MCEGLNQGLDTVLYHATFPQASGYYSTFISDLLFLSPVFSTEARLYVLQVKMIGHE